MFNLNISTKLITPLVSAIVFGTLVEAGATLAITFKETTKARLEFFDNQKNQIGSGFFDYNSNPVEGTFLVFVPPNVPSSYRFVTDPSQIPENASILDSISISADEDFRLVTNIEAQILGVELNPVFDDVLTPGDSFTNALLFRPTETEFFVPGFGGIFSINTGDSRNLNLNPDSSWFLTDTFFGASATQQIILNDNGTLVGSLNSIPPISGSLGTWTAQAIPEPLTILGSVTALGFGALLKKKKLSSKTQ